MQMLGGYSQARARLFNANYAGKTVVAFGHGTFQNGVETILLSRGEDVEPRVVFTRKHGQSHLKRGFPHRVWPDRKTDV